MQIYLLSDLPGCPAMVAGYDCVCVSQDAFSGRRWSARPGYVPGQYWVKGLATWDFEPSPDQVAAGLAAALAIPATTTPTLPASKLAEKIKARYPLTVSELLADPSFRAEARRCAEADRSFSSKLLEWEITEQPEAMALLERGLAPVMGKSFIVYGRKS